MNNARPILPPPPSGRTVPMQVAGVPFTISIGPDAQYPRHTRWSARVRGVDVSGVERSPLEALRAARDFLQISPLTREEAEARLDDHEASEEEIELLAASLREDEAPSDMGETVRCGAVSGVMRVAS
jgi:hypothetical protein